MPQNNVTHILGVPFSRQTETELLECIQDAKGKKALRIYTPNTEMILLYHRIGSVINEHKTWGSKFIDNLSHDIRLAFPDATGYSVRNLKYMSKFAATYTDHEFVQQVVAQIPWGHTVVLLDKISDGTIRNWYVEKTIERSTLGNVD